MLPSQEHPSCHFQAFLLPPPPPPPLKMTCARPFTSNTFLLTPTPGFHTGIFGWEGEGGACISGKCAGIFAKPRPLLQSVSMLHVLVSSLSSLYWGLYCSKSPSKISSGRGEILTPLPIVFPPGQTPTGWQDQHQLTTKYPLLSHLG